MLSRVFTINTERQIPISYRNQNVKLEFVEQLWFENIPLFVILTKRGYFILALHVTAFVFGMIGGFIPKKLD